MNATAAVIRSSCVQCNDSRVLITRLKSAFTSLMQVSVFVYLTENLQEPLEDQLQQFEKVKVVRMLQREGLVRARLRGAEVSRGEVLTFLDSHCEVTEGWLEPLLVRIAQNRSNVVCPVIEVINADDFGYQTSAVIHERGGFSWDLFFTWKAIPEEERKRREDETDYIRQVTNFGVLLLYFTTKCFS